MTQEFDPLNTEAHDKVKAEETEAERVKKERWAADFRWLMANVEGRRIVHALLEQAGNARSSFSMNGLEMAFREGNRNMGIFIQAAIDANCPERYHQMVKEHKADGNRSGGNTKR
jgi:hypothetical protein